MRILQVGAGSMGTRRLRDLYQRPDATVALLEIRKDRRTRAAERFGIPVFERADHALSWKPEALVISTPPDQHFEFIRMALDHGLHHFCEEHVWTFDFREIEAVSRNKSLVSASSCSAHFLPLVRKLKEVVAERLGRLQAYQMMLSTWAPSWHPDEGMEFYARHRETSAAREMVPFELLYLNHIFGCAEAVAGAVSRLGQLELDSEDVWSLQMRLEDGAHGQLTVLMSSPSSARRGICFGTSGCARFDLFSGEILLSFPGLPEARICCGPQQEAIESAYKEEIDTFIEAIRGKLQWPCSYHDSAMATATLAAAEFSSITGRWERVDALRQPGRTPGDYTESR
jgi:predicted dehydrogenase